MVSTFSQVRGAVWDNMASPTMTKAFVSCAASLEGYQQSEEEEEEEVLCDKPMVKDRKLKEKRTKTKQVWNVRLPL